VTLPHEGSESPQFGQATAADETKVPIHTGNLEKKINITTENF
jgi:hypothetical protein